MENSISFQSELNKSILVSRNNLHESLERLKFLTSNFNGSDEHLRALEFVENSVAIEVANLKHLNKIYRKEASSPSIFRKILNLMGFAAHVV
jgi:hypothetical protein